MDAACRLALKTQAKLSAVLALNCKKPQTFMCLSAPSNAYALSVDYCSCSWAHIYCLRVGLAGQMTSLRAAERSVPVQGQGTASES